MFTCARCNSMNYPPADRPGCQCCGYMGREARVSTQTVTDNKTHEYLKKITEPVVIRDNETGKDIFE